MRNDMIVCWFSCGCASAVATKLTLDKYGAENVRIVNNPIKEEHADNKRFLQDCEKWFNKKIEFAVSKEFPDQSIVSVFDKRKYMSGTSGAPCTLALKKRARHDWERINGFDYSKDKLVMGFTAEEKKRAEWFMLDYRCLLTPLIDENLTKEDCFNVIEKAGIRLPEVYAHGLPNANCIGCVKSTSTWYWNLIKKEFPKEFIERCEQSRRIKCKLTRYKGKRLYLDELTVDMKGRPQKHFNFECGLFCEVKL